MLLVRTTLRLSPIHGIGLFADLDVADNRRATANPLTADRRHRELVMFSILIAILERAFLMYKDKSDTVRLAQWNGLEGYICDWCSRPNFAAALPTLKNQFDQNFCTYLDGVIASTRAAAASTATPS